MATTTLKMPVYRVSGFHSFKVMPGIKAKIGKDGRLGFVLMNDREKMWSIEFSHNNWPKNSEGKAAKVEDLVLEAVWKIHALKKGTPEETKLDTIEAPIDTSNGKQRTQDKRRLVMVNTDGVDTKNNGVGFIEVITGEPRLVGEIEGRSEKKVKYVKALYEMWPNNVIRLWFVGSPRDKSYALFNWDGEIRTLPWDEYLKEAEKHDAENAVRKAEYEAKKAKKAADNATEAAPTTPETPAAAPTPTETVAPADDLCFDDMPDKQAPVEDVHLDPLPVQQAADKPKRTRRPKGNGNGAKKTTKSNKKSAATEQTDNTAIDTAPATTPDTPDGGHGGQAATE